jgi:hypothetical protein
VPATQPAKEEACLDATEDLPVAPDTQMEAVNKVSRI